MYVPTDIKNIIHKYARDPLREKLYWEMEMFFEFAEFDGAGTPDQMCLPNYDDQDDVDFLNDQPESFQMIGYCAWRMHTSFPTEKPKYADYFSVIPNHFF